MDFLASSIALMESQGREMDASKVCGNMSAKQRELFNQRLAHYRQALLVEHIA
ncbi:glycogen synthesis protein [Hafnia alvei]|nr:glycogen synthesis protein [Hafnia alvei]